MLKASRVDGGNGKIFFFYLFPEGLFSEAVYISLKNNNEGF